MPPNSPFQKKKEAMKFLLTKPRGLRGVMQKKYIADAESKVRNAKKDPSIC